MNDTALYVALAAAVLAWIWLSRGGAKTSSADARRLVAEGAILVDVRSPAEFAGGHLEGAINVPVEAIGARAPELARRGQKLVVYCRSGARSGSAAAALARAGAQVFDLGAMSRW